MAIFNDGQLLKKIIFSSKSRLHFGGFVVVGSKQEVLKVVSRPKYGGKKNMELYLYALNSIFVCVCKGNREEHIHQRHNERPQCSPTDGIMAPNIGK